jgi:hypothetical protein
MAFVYCLLLCDLSSPAASQKGDDAADSSDVVSVTLPEYDEPPIVPIIIGDETFSFLLNSGAPVNGFDEDLRSYLGSPRSRKRSQHDSRATYSTEDFPRAVNEGRCATSR